MAGAQNKGAPLHVRKFAAVDQIALAHAGKIAPIE